MEQQTFTDADRILDALYAERQLALGYNDSLYDCERLTLRNLFLDLLDEEHRLHAALLDEMTKRGWRTSHAATPQELAAVREKYQQ